MTNNNVFPLWLNELISEIYSICFNLFKLIAPIIIFVKVIEEFGGIEYIGIVLEPIMELVGLPSSMGLVWATTLITNVYGGMFIFIGLAAEETLSVAQVTVLGSMMLVAHALPIESRIIQKAGVRFLYIFMLRLVSALIVGFILHHLYASGDYLTEPSQILWDPALSTDNSLSTWLINQIKSFAQVFVIIAILVSFLKLLKFSGVEKLIIKLLQPLLRVIGLGKDTSSITIIGVLLGITYGGGLLINESKNGSVSRKELFGSLTLLALMHSIIEDTILILLLGAHLSGIFYFRVFFALMLTTIIIRITRELTDKSFNRYFVYPENTQTNILKLTCDICSIRHTLMITNV